MQKIKTFVKNNFWELVIATTGSFFALIPYLVSLKSCHNGVCGYVFSSVNGHDGLWHIGVFTHTIGTANFDFPAMYGITLTGYNMLLDYLMYAVWKLGIPAFTTYFIVTPLLLCVGYVIAVFKSAKTFFTKKHEQHVYFFLMFFGSSMAFYVSVWQNNFTQARSFLTWEFPGSLLLQPHSMYLNLPFVAGITVLLIFLSLLHSNKLKPLYAIFFGFLLFGFKVYAAVFAIIFLSLILVLNPNKLKINVANIVFYTLGCISAYILIVGPPASAGLPFIFAPFAITFPQIESPNLFTNIDYARSKYILEASGKFSPRLLYIKLLTACLYFIYNLGARLIILLTLIPNIVKNFNKPAKFTLAIFIATTFCFLIPIFFIQKDHYYDSNQFGYVAMFALTLLIAKPFANMLNGKLTTKFLFFAICFVFLVPTVANMRYANQEVDVVSQNKTKTLQKIVSLAKPDDLTVTFPSVTQAYFMLYPIKFYNGLNFMAESTAVAGPMLNERQKLSKANYLELVAKLPKSVKFIIFSNHGVKSEDLHARLDGLGDAAKFVEIYKNNEDTLLMRQ